MNGVILYNRGSKCLARLIVCLHSIRKYWDGQILLFQDQEIPPALHESLKSTFNLTIQEDRADDIDTMTRRIQCSKKSPFEVSVYIDADTLVIGKFDELFGWAKSHDFVATNFAGWLTSGRTIGHRIEGFTGMVPDDWITKAKNFGPAINGGVYAFSRTTIFDEWERLSNAGAQKGMYIPDEVALQVLLPQFDIFVADKKFNVSVKHDPDTQDKRIIHYHGRKHVSEWPLCRLWIEEFIECLKENTCNVREFCQPQYQDRRLTHFLAGHNGQLDLLSQVKNLLDSSTNPAELADSEVTIVTAVDPKYVELLRLTYPTWQSYKNINAYKMIVFVNGMPLADSRLDFLRNPNVALIEWDMKVEDQREKMLSSFILGAARYVQTKYWMKLDADSFATNTKPLFEPWMKDYAFVGHRWGYSWATHIEALDKWADAKGLKCKNGPMFPRGKVEGRKFWHADRKRTISFIQLHSLDFTKLCADLAGERLPVPSHDTYMFYIADRLGYPLRVHNFKKHQGFDQGRGKDQILQRLIEVRSANPKG